MSAIEIIYLKPQDPDVVYLNSDEPVVFEVLEEKVEKKIDLKPQVKVHNNINKQKDKQTKLKKKKSKPKKNKNVKRVFAIFAIMMLFGVFAFNLGYMPIKAFLHVPEPVGCAGEIEAEDYMGEYPVLKGIPKLDKIKYKIFVSDATLETVANHYKYDLDKDGYKLDYKGVVTKKDITFHYYGFVKGITAVGIILTDEVEDIFGHETAVLSTIGSIYDYKEIITWYKSHIA